MLKGGGGYAETSTAAILEMCCLALNLGFDIP